MMTGHLSRRWAVVAVLAMFAVTVGLVAAPASAKAEQERFEHWLNVKGIWHTGAINHINSDYVEGDVVPHRIVFNNYSGERTFAFSYEYEDPKIPAMGHDWVDYVNATEASALEGDLGTLNVFRFKGMTDVEVSGPSLSHHGDRVDEYYVVTATFTQDVAYFYYGAHLALDADYPNHYGASSWHGGNLENRFDRDGEIGPRGDRTLSMKLGPAEPEDQFGRIVIEKTVPGSSETEFEFEVPYGPKSIKLADNQSHDSGPLGAGTYVIEELVSGLPDGWFFKGVACRSSAVSTASTWTITGAEVEVELAAPETVTCTFENDRETPENQGRIIVEKKATQSSTEGFAFSSTYGGAFSLTDGDSNNSGPIAVGPHSITESLTSAQDSAGWDLIDIDCSRNIPDGSSTWVESSAGVDVTLAAGETVTCTFENRLTTPVTRVSQPGEIRVVKEAPGVDPGPFAFQASWMTAGFTLGKSDMHSSGDLPAGTYSVGEVLTADQVAAGWQLSSARCTDGSRVNAIQLSEGEVVTCTFENVQVLGESIESTTTTTVEVAAVTVSTLPFTGTGAMTLGLLGLSILSLGGLVLVTASSKRTK